MKSYLLFNIFLVFIAGFLLPNEVVQAQWTTQTLQVSVPVTIDYWQYENGSNPAARTLGPAWCLPPGFDGSSRRHGMDILVFDLPNLPPVVEVQGAKIRFFDIPQASWLPTGDTTTDGIDSRLELFAAGFGPSYVEATWTGNEPMQAGQGTHDPYPRDFMADVNVDDNITTSTPWCIGQPIGYTPGAMSSAFPVEFELDAQNGTMAQELMNDIAQQRSSWVFSSTYEIDFVGDPGTLPNLIMTEGVGSFPGSAPPTLHLDLVVEVFNSVPDWELYQ